MDLFEYLQTRMGYVIQHLERLITSFDDMEHLDRDEMIQKGGAIFDIVVSTIQIEDNLLYPKLREKGLLLEEYGVIRELQQEVEDIIESSVMMHVDEPSFEFRDNLQALHRCLLKYRRFDEKVVFPVARTALGHHEMRDVLRHIQEETSHEGKAERILQTPF
jgi:hemerythrin-like domain-containing protein